MISKHFHNETPNDIEITLYVAGKKGQELNTYGSRVEKLDGGATCDVSIGDLHHSYLQGIRIRSNRQGECLSLQRGTHEARGALYQLLNDHHTFRIGHANHSFTIDPVQE